MPTKLGLLSASIKLPINYLGSKLGIPVKYLPVKSYPAAVTAFRHNQVQLAWFGGLTGVQARQLTPGATAIAQGYEDAHFRSYFIAHASAQLTPSDHLPAALHGKTITFGSKSSTSRRLMPEFYLRMHFHTSLNKIFSHVGFSGNHSRTIALVQSGAYQIGAVNYQVWEQELAEGKIDLSRVNIFWTTLDCPDYHWTVRGDLDNQWEEGFTVRLCQALLDFDDPELLSVFPRSSFISTNDADYDRIEASAKEIGLLNKNNNMRTPILDLQCHGIQYGEKTVLAPFHLQLIEGQHVAILGSSGAGKTTLLRVIFDFLNTSSLKTALIPQTPGLVENISVYHNVYMGRLDQFSTISNLQSA